MALFIKNERFCDMPAADSCLSLLFPQPSDVERLFAKYGHITTCKIKDGYGFVVSYSSVWRY
jgi:hypothetical protein